MTLEELRVRLPSPKDPPECLVALDPGETTGACVFYGTNMKHAEQLHTGDMTTAPQVVWNFLKQWEPDVIIIEDYRVYQWRTQAHTWAALHTPRLIGSVETYASVVRPEVKLIKQMAQLAKGFCTDDKLKEWGFYITGERHSRDAIRHACFYILWPRNPPVVNLKKGASI